MHPKARQPLLQSLTDGEELFGRVQGWSKQAMAVTADRVIVVEPGILAGNVFGAYVTSYPVRQISGAEFRRRLTTSLLIVRAAGLPLVTPSINGPNDGYKMPVRPIASEGSPEASFFQPASLSYATQKSAPVGLRPSLAALRSAFSTACFAAGSLARAA